MDPKQPFVLVPTVGTRPADILRDFDGRGDRIRVDVATCEASLRRGNASMRGIRSPYEATPTPETACLALEAGARQARQVGLREMAEVLTTPDVGARRAMFDHLAQGLAPESRPSPAPAGPSLG